MSTAAMIAAVVVPIVIENAPHEEDALGDDSCESPCADDEDGMWSACAASRGSSG